MAQKEHVNTHWEAGWGRVGRAVQAVSGAPVAGLGDDGWTAARGGAGWERVGVTVGTGSGDGWTAMTAKLGLTTDRALISSGLLGQDDQPAIFPAPLKNASKVGCATLMRCDALHRTARMLSGL